MNPNEGSAFLGIADCMHQLNDNQTVLEVLNKAISCPETSLYALLKRAKMYAALGQIEKSIDDFNKYVAFRPDDAEAYFEKAMVILKLSQYNEAALCLEQVIKNDKSNNYTNQAVFHLGAIKIRERDYYGALHTFKRFQGHKELKDQKTLRHYAEAVINLMKRKYKDGIAYFSKLIKNGDIIIQEYLGNCYAYRAYGYCAINKYDKSLQDFKKSALVSNLNKASKYNQSLAHGLYLAGKKDFQGALKDLAKCHKYFPKNPDPLIYHASILLNMAYFTTPKQDSHISESLNLLEKAFKLRDPESELYFYKSILKYLSNQISDSLEDIKLAIEKAEDNVTDHYILRGLCYSSAHMYDEALQDFSIAIQLNEDLDYAYSYRARVAYLSDDSELAYNDFQKFILISPDNPDAHIQAGNLLMSSGSYEDALNAYNTASELKFSCEIAYQKAKCYVLLNNLDESIPEIDKILQIQSTNQKAIKDKHILVFLRTISTENKDRTVFNNGIEMCNK